MQYTHYHVLVWAYDKQVGDDYQNVRKVDVILAGISPANIAGEAKKRTEEIFPSLKYSVRDVIQHDGDEK
jgi:hypothetical protein